MPRHQQETLPQNGHVIPIQELPYLPTDPSQKAERVSQKKKRGRPPKVDGDADVELRETRLSKELAEVRLLKDKVETTQWLTLCLPDGTRIAPHAVGYRNEPCDPPRVSAKIGTPLYLARKVFDHVIDARLQRATKWRRWQRLWRGSTGHGSGPLLEYAVCIRGDGKCIGASRPRDDALVGLDGIEVLIEDVACDSLTQNPRDFFFFEMPWSASRARSSEPCSSSSSPSRTQPNAEQAKELKLQAVHLLNAAIEQGASKASIERMIRSAGLPCEVVASLRESASLQPAGATVQAVTNEPPLRLALT